MFHCDFQSILNQLEETLTSHAEILQTKIGQLNIKPDHHSSNTKTFSAIRAPPADTSLSTDVDMTPSGTTEGHGFKSCIFHTTFDYALIVKPNYLKPVFIQIVYEHFIFVKGILIDTVSPRKCFCPVRLCRVQQLSLSFLKFE